MTHVPDREGAAEREALLAATNEAFARLDDPDALIDAILAILVPEHADYAVLDLFAADGSFERYAFAGPPDIAAEIARLRSSYGTAGAPAGSSWQVATSGDPVFVPAGGPPADWPETTRRAYRALGVHSAVVVPLVDGTQTLGALSVAHTDRTRDGFAPSAITFYATIGARVATALRRTRAVRALVATERVYRTLADQMPQIVVLADALGRITYLNERATAFVGRASVHRYLFDNWRVLVHPDDVESIAEQAAVDPANIRMRCRLRDETGAYRWFLVHSVPVSDESGAILSWISTATDIDEMQRREHRLRLAAEASEMFARALDMSSVLDELTKLAVTHLADYCAVYTREDGGALLPVAAAHRDPTKLPAFVSMSQTVPFDPNSFVLRAERTQSIERLGPIPEEVYAQYAQPQNGALLRELRINAALHVPLLNAGACIGVLSLIGTDPQRVFDDDDVQLAQMVAQRAAVAIANARLYERQRDVAGTLQKAFLPASLPHVTGISLDAVYVPSTRDIAIGGDWYDADVRGDGAIALSIGDIAGHGLAAAVPMGKMRQTFRVLGAMADDPAYAVTIADAMLQREHPEVYVTAFAALFDPVTGALRYCNAGHPAPYVRATDGSVRRIEASGLPMGITELASPASSTDRLAPGELLVAFTDGLIEIDRDIDAGERTVAAALGHPAFSLCSTPAQLLRAMMVRGDIADDVAILSLRNGGGADWTFDTERAEQAQAIRAAFVARIIDEGVGVGERAMYELVLGELLGNAARHAPGILDVAVGRRDGQLVLRALDRGPGLQWRSRLPPDDRESGRGLFLVSACSTAVHCEPIRGFGTYLDITL